MTAKLTPLGDLVFSKILDCEAKLVKQAEAGLLLPWQQEELAIVRELLRTMLIGMPVTSRA